MLLLVHLIAVSAYAGFQWTVRVLVYPQFDQVPPGAFPAYERAHQRRVARVVGPLFAAQAVTSGWLLLDRPAGTPWGLVVAAATVTALVLLVTALGAVPLHRRLDAGWDAAAHRRLLRVDAVRVGLATAGVVLALLLVD
ncbi:DUF1772 domain-containing protein [Modestobacter sp. VKM Ac-2985]|uniref:DUF1772 domain-containing protein n=1 Tax=Modestobacter sp. VKM Ac-2985 TaxID=3004139 RepID=UPI0022AB51BD|nr:DUF1772 domain-containing protein [Modestobacter sp. VKM Ac-2985]MCZ2837413.1 DUF1772 domain-containing protein [Modestobacter sp. VKM Ac-2985]